MTFSQRHLPMLMILSRLWTVFLIASADEDEPKREAFVRASGGLHV